MASFLQSPSSYSLRTSKEHTYKPPTGTISYIPFICILRPIPSVSNCPAKLPLGNSGGSSRYPYTSPALNSNVSPFLGTVKAPLILLTAMVLTGLQRRQSRASATQCRDEGGFLVRGWWWQRLCALPGGRTLVVPSDACVGGCGVNGNCIASPIEPLSDFL